jgi:hypothetical protein
MGSMFTRLSWAVLPLATGLLGGLTGCTKDAANPLGAGNPQTQVSLAMSLSRTASTVPLMKADGGGVVDSLRIDSVTVVVASIRFQTHIDTVKIDSLGDDHGLDDGDTQVQLKGPFLVRLRDSLTANFADQSIPAGTYDGVTLRIRKFSAAEHFEDSDDHNRHHGGHSDAGLSGSSVVVWGSVYKNGAWAPFVLALDLELQIRVRGNFVIPQAISSVSFALNFDIGSWFKDPDTGAFLDPTDSSNHIRDLFRKAVRAAFGSGHGGHDHDHDGHPDD